MSTLRARCPDCRTITAVAIDDEYQCHSCGREYAAGLVRVPRAWGSGGEAMAEAAQLPLPYPEAAVIEEASLEDQIAAQIRNLPARPLVLGGCCCSHVGAIRGLAARRGGRLAVVWIDAHGDLNTPESSPSGNAWGMPLRMAIDAGAVDPADVALVGARSLDPPELEYMAATGIDDDLGRALEGCDRVYVAFDCDVLRPGELAVFMPEPGGPTLAEAEELLRDIAARGADRRARADGIARGCRPGRPRPPRRGRRPVTLFRGGGSKMAQMSATDKIDVSIEHKQATLDDGTAKKHPNTCPGLRVALPRRGAEGAPARMPAVRPPLPGQGPRADRAAGRRGHVHRGRDVAALRRPARVLRPQAVHRAPGRGRGVDGARRRDDHGHGPDRGAPVPARGDGLLVHGRLDGQRRRREVRARLRARGGGRAAARLGLVLRRRPHAGGDPGADAAAEDGLRARGAARGRRRDDLRADPSDDGRPARELRLARRRARGRAGRADVVRRPAGRRPDDAREAPGRLRPRRVEPPLRPHRPHRAAHRAAARRRPADPAVRGRS